MSGNLRKGEEATCLSDSGFDRDFATSSPSITSFSFSEKEKEGKRKTAQGVPPLGELHYFAAGRGGEIMNSRRLRPPRPPGERVRPVAAATEMGCRAEKVSVFGAKNVNQQIKLIFVILLSPLSSQEMRLVVASQLRGNAPYIF